jgi:hypothetical protein
VKPEKAAGLNNKPIAVPKTMEKSFLCIVASKKIAQRVALRQGRGVAHHHQKDNTRTECKQ